MIRSLLAAGLIAFSATTTLAAEKIRFAVTDLNGLEQLQQEFKPFQDALEDITGLEVELFPISSRTAAVEAMNSDMLDLVLTGPAEYVVMKELADARVVTAWQRTDYYSEIVVMANGPINKVEDLKGQRVSFASAGSTSQHLGPAQALADLGLTVNEDYEGVFISRNVATEALIRGDIAAVSMTRTYLRQARELYPDEAFSVVVRSGDLPNDVLVASRDLDDETFETVRSAFIEHGGELMAAVLNGGKDNEKFVGGSFITNIDDSEYNYVRSMYETVGIPFDNFTN